LDQLTGISDCRILNVSVTAANGTGLNTDVTNQPTAISFTVCFDRDEFILGEWNNICKSLGNSASGTYTNAYDAGFTPTAYVGVNGSVAITTTAIALQDIVTNAICTGSTTGNSRSYRVYSPATNGDSQIKVTITQPSTPANIYTTVSVTQVSGTTITGSPL
jgi:hypothetical protein